MERLTTKFLNGYLFNLPSVNDEKAQEEYLGKLSEKIGAYEDAEEQGLLLRLPCKVGDTVYFVDFDENEYDEAIVESIEFGRNGFLINSDCEIGTYLGAEYLFLTQEEAEQALKQMGE